MLVLSEVLRLKHPFIHLTNFLRHNVPGIILNMLIIASKLCVGGFLICHRAIENIKPVVGSLTLL